jgi:probable rRNA maturation factor
MAVFVADEQQSGPVDLDRLRRLAEHVLADQGVPEAMDTSILLVDRATIAELNERHLEQRGPTDVLAFPMDLPGETPAGEPAILGDVVVCPDIARRQASERGKPLQAELDLLVVHGLLHLLGHDHADPDERAEMFALTERLLASFAEALA